MQAKIPPHDLDAERSVLGAILIDKDAIVNVSDFLQPTYFYDDRHTSIYEGMQTLYEHRQPIDVVTLTDQVLGQVTDVVLHPARNVERVGADQSDPHGSGRAGAGAGGGARQQVGHEDPLQHVPVLRVGGDPCGDRVRALLGHGGDPLVALDTFGW